MYSHFLVDKNACLSAHNARRARHGARPLTWDDTLAHHAQEWADHLLGIGRMVHATGTGEGETWLTDGTLKSLHARKQ